MFKAMIGAFALTISGAAFAQDAPAPKKECCCCKDCGGKKECCDKHEKGEHGDAHGQMNH